MKRALFIFRRDLRLQDNRGLLMALKAADEVILSFIFTPEQIEENPFRSNRCLQFMIESLEDLEEDIFKQGGKLHLFYGKPEDVIETCVENLHVEGVFVNRDYTPYSIQRDKKIQTVCDKHSVTFQAFHDLLLHPIEETLKNDGHPYTVFTPFYHHSQKFAVAKSEQNNDHRYSSQPIPFSEDRSIYAKCLPKRMPQLRGGRQACIGILNNLQRFSAYPLERDYPEQDKTTHLSAHLKFTTCSIREVYHAMFEHLGSDCELIRALYWRDFFTLIALHFPHVFEGSFKRKFDQLQWRDDKSMYELWCQGRTGFPIVDAGMRELNETGFMHNRLRMITASFLVKDLRLNWRWGEKYFAQHLIDYDPAVNNGNWQWAASTGCDAQPYFRIFNPWLQSKRFDVDCHYIKKWVPELSSLSPGTIHKWYLEKQYSLFHDYPAPIVDHSKESAITLALYKEIASLEIF